MARIGPGRARGSRPGRGRGQRRTSTWEISDSDTEGPAGAEADSEVAARARDPAEERRVAAEALRLLRPEQAVRRLVVHVDPGAECQGRGPSSCLRLHLITGCWYPAHCKVEGHLSRPPFGHELARAYQLGRMFKRQTLGSVPHLPSWSRL